MDFNHLSMKFAIAFTITPTAKITAAQHVSASLSPRCPEPQRGVTRNMQSILKGGF